MLLKAFARQGRLIEDIIRGAEYCLTISRVFINPSLVISIQTSGHRRLYLQKLLNLFPL